MHLNNTSYVHKMIRRNCSQLEVIADMKMVTNLSEEFEQIQFLNKLGYIIIDYHRFAILTLSHKMTDLELELAKDILMYLDWLETGKEIQEKFVTKM